MSADGGMRFRIERERAGDREVAVVVLDGDFDLPAVEVFEQAMEEVWASAPEAVVVDTSDLRFVDSSGLNELARLRDPATESEVPVGIVVVAGSALDRVVEMSGLGELLGGAPDRAAAIAALG